MYPPPQQNRRRVLVFDFQADRVFYRGASAYFRRTGRYHVELHTERGESLRWLDDVSFDGFISVPDEVVLNELARRGQPTVSLLSTLSEHPTPYLVPDDDAIGRLGAEHLIAQGYRRFAYFGTGDDWAMARQRAFVAKLAEHDFVCVDTSSASPNRQPAGWALITNESFVAHWLAQLSAPVAIMAADDRLARLLGHVCISQGLRIPQRAAILGVDNIELYCEFAEPTLSSVDSGFERMGFEAAAILDRMIGGEKVPPVAFTVAPTGVTARQSTASLAFMDSEVHAALQFVREHACDDIDVDQVCAHVAISRRQLERRFLDVLGHTPFEELRRQRMEKAKELLVNTRLSMLQVAVRCGYESASSFVTAFRNRVGCTPELYRKRNAVS